MRGTSRREEGLAAIEAVGIEPAQADPERPGTLLDLVGDVTAVCWLLGSAAGDPENIDAIHGPRLERFLEHLVETPVRRFVYEATGSVDTGAPGARSGRGRAAASSWRIPVAVVETDQADRQAWVEAMRNVFSLE